MQPYSSGIMIPAVAQTLANILVAGTSLESIEQISFHRPGIPQAMPRGVNLYFYDLRQASMPWQNGSWQNGSWQNGSWQNGSWQNKLGQPWSDLCQSLESQSLESQSLESQSLENDLPGSYRINSCPIHSGQTLGRVVWFDVSFLVSAYDYTALGAQQLLSESLTLCLRYSRIPQCFLNASLQGYGDLPLMVNLAVDWVELWKVLEIPLRPALCVTVTVPTSSQMSVPMLMEKLL